MARVSNFEKFYLLLWKNWLITWNNKIQMIIEIVLPPMFVYLVAFTRKSIKPVPERNPVLYQKFNFNQLEFVDWVYMFFHFLHPKTSDPIIHKLVYSPNNSQILDSIMNEVELSLKFQPSIGYADATELENSLKKNNYFAGVQFNSKIIDPYECPKKLSFSLRFPNQLRTTPPQMGLTWNTHRLWASYEPPGPRNPNEQTGGYVDYKGEGFLAVQNAITRAYLKKASKSDYLPMMYMQRFPYPAYISDPLLSNFELFVTFIIALGFIYNCMTIAKNITAEKENQLKEFLTIMGIRNWIQWTAWFIKCFLMLAMSSILVIYVLKMDPIPVFKQTDWTILFFFFCVYCTTIIFFCFMLAVFFSKANTAAGVVGLILFMSYIPFDILNYSFDELSTIFKYLSCLLVNNSLGFAMKMILRFEIIQEGLQWNNLFTPISVDNDFSVGGVIITMLISCFIYMIICLYIEKIYPGEYGVPKKWYFPFTEFYLIFHHPKTRDSIKRLDEHMNMMTTNNKDMTASVYEMDSEENRTKNLMIKNLHKIYKTKMAVNDVSMDLYENEITVLLGHNGAGKTTTISIITGMICPTSGTVIINGADIQTNTEDARASLGYCPQYNVLFNDLTVTNHLVLFSRLKGVKSDQIDEEVDRYLKATKLEDKANVRSSKLSGGMKRKLSLCAALCGSSQVVICDEPSSGMDPAARRQIWTLLQNEKFGRTILLTTHMMDEADVLGDRIAILSDGILKCYGRPFYLKKKFGSAYRLVCVKGDNCDSSMVTLLLRKYIPQIETETEIGSELSYQLPLSASSIFPRMLKDLESSAEKLKLIGYGIDSASIEDVFIKVNRKETVEKESSDNDNGNPIESIYQSSHLADGNRLLLSQWEAMLRKKSLNTLRNKLLLFVQNLIAIVFITAAIMIFQKNSFGKTVPSMTFSLRQYPSAVMVLEKDNSIKANSLEAKTAEEYEKLVKTYGPKYHIEIIKNGKTFSDYILNLHGVEQFRVNKRYIAAATIRDQEILVWLNNQPLHTAPLTLNLVYNAMARALLDPSYEIEVTNAPVQPDTLSSQIDNLDNKKLGHQLALYICYCMCYVIAFYTMFLIKERESRAKLLQFVGGLGVWSFWMSHFLWDYFTFVITAILSTLTIAYFQEDGFSTIEELGILFFVFLWFGFAAIFFSYIFSMFAKEPASGFGRFAACNFFSAVGMQITVWKIGSEPLNKKDLAEVLNKIFRIIPHYTLAQCIKNLHNNTITKKLCDSITKKFTLSHNILCHMAPQCCDVVPWLSWEEPGIGQNILYFFFTGICSMAIVIFKDYRITSNVWNKVNRKLRTPPTIDQDLEEDVANEREYVKRMSSDELQIQNLVLDRVTKYYGKFLAVNQVSVCVRHSECFGLLGVNGAGKTTTFKMMTGDERISFGDAYVKGMNLNSEIGQVYKVIGYCPQFDALLDDLTGREMLKIFCLLRGIPKTQIHQISMNLAKSFGFERHLDKQTRAYSGGNKRKLSTAIAVMGNPLVIYLDEPTTGMDPAARRQLWNMVCRIRDSGKSIVLTSHSMEECEALCTRLAIMVNGEFKCLGSTQKLKNKFSKGLILKIKLKKTEEKSRRSIFNTTTTFLTTNDDNITTIKNFMEKNFPNSVLQEQFQEVLTFRITSSDTRWSEIFEKLEKEKNNLNIEDYSVNQTTLEEIFLEFARKQRESIKLEK